MRYILIIFLLPLALLAANLNLDIPFAAPQGDPALQDFGKLAYGTISSPGTPQLPVKSINVLLPAGAKVLGWQINMAPSSRISGSAPKVNSFFSDGQRNLGASGIRNITSASSYLGVRQWGDLRYAAFSVLPATWDGQAWSWSSGCQISIEYQSQSEQSGHIPTTLTERSFFANPQALDAWYITQQQRNYDVLVISTPALYASLTNWISYRQAQGLVVSFTDIAVALNQGSGSTDAEKLRSYLQSQYQTNAFSYLLLIGDHDTIPPAFLTPEPDGLDTVPSDFFYADLSSDWDTDNDGRFGEYSTGYMNQDYGVDFTPEVFVGRISNNSATQVSAIANRIVAYEQSSAAWKQKNLLPAAWLNYISEPEANMPPTDGALYMEILRNTSLANQQNTTMYEQQGVVPSFPSDYPLDYDQFRSLLSTQSWGFVNWSAHGSSSSSSRRVWVSDPNANNFPDYDEMEWMNLVNRQSFDNLNNSDGTVIFAASCYNGQLDANNTSLAEYALQKKGVGVLAATRTGWYKVGWLNPGWGGLSSYNYHLVENFRESQMDLGTSHAGANLLHSQYYLFGDPIDSGGIIWPELQNIYTYMLFGDPLVGYNPANNEPAGEILVWEPSQAQGLPLVNALREATGMNVIYSDKLIVDYTYLNNFEAVFCLFGYGDNSYVLNPSSFEYTLLNGYLENGGAVYAEGNIGWDPMDTFWGKFGTHAPLDMLAYVEAVKHMGSNHVWPYADVNRYTQALLPFTDVAHPVFMTSNTEYSDANIAIWNSNGNYTTVASSFRLTDVLAAEYDLADLMVNLCDTLGIINAAPVANNDASQVPLVQNLSSYPNPSFGASTIRFRLNKATAVKLEVYNLKGQKVQTIKQAKLASGDHSLLWDGRNFTGKACANGIYFLRLETEQGRSSLKQVLMR